MPFGKSHEQPTPNEFEVINNITAKCRRSGCNWKATGSIEVEIHTEATVTSSEIFELCRQHHDETRTEEGSMSDHNQFLLLKNDKEVGFASVSSGGSTGIFNL